MNPSVAYTLGMIGALACTILLFVLVIPEKKRDELNGFFKFLHDLFNFKFLVLEKILKFLYVFSTIACIGIGFFLLFSGYYGYYYRQSLFLPGLLLMILGPIFMRIIYEFMMMAILLVQNTISINRKLKNGTAVSSGQPAEEQPDAAPARVCPNCGAEAPGDAGFCVECGTKLGE